MSFRLSAVVAVATATALGAAAGADRVTRLDRSRIAASEIDDAVARLMRPADVTGVALAIFNDRRPAYVKTFGFRDKVAADLL